MWDLYRLQQTDIKIKDAETRLASLGAPKERQEAVDEAKKRQAEVEDTLRKNSTVLKNAELELATKESKKKQLEQKLYSGKVVNPKELAGLQDEINELGTQKGTLEEQILELMDVVDGLKHQIESAKAEVYTASKELDAAVASAGEEKISLQSSLGELKEKRKSQAGVVEESLLKRYETLRARKDGVAVARVKGGSCMVCGVSIPPTSKMRLESGQMETCKTCGRILIVETVDSHAG